MMEEISIIVALMLFSRIPRLTLGQLLLHGLFSLFEEGSPTLPLPDLEPNHPILHHW
jgi:hypothetical protein